MKHMPNCFLDYHKKLIYNKKIELVVFKMPSTNVGCYEEIELWLKLGWIKLYEEEK